MQEFQSDLELLFTCLASKMSAEVMQSLKPINERLNYLSDRHEVKINHSVMEVICASYLIAKGYRVEVERDIGGGMTCDLFGIGSKNEVIVEVETGFVPPEEALGPIAYRRTRVASKIAMYGIFFAHQWQAAPNYHILQIPKVLSLPPGERDRGELSSLVKECEGYYKSPPISIMELMSCHLDAIYIIWVDDCRVVEMGPVEYLDSYSRS